MSLVITPVLDRLIRGDERVPVGVYQLQIATCDQLTPLHYSLASSRAVQKRLKLLVDNGYLQADATPVKHQHGQKTYFSPLYYYTLGPMGMKYLQALGVDTHDAWRAAKEIDKHALFIEHTLELNDVLIAASLIHQADAAFQVESFIHERVLKRSPVTVTWRERDATRRQAVIPDAVLIFRRTGTDLGLRVLIEHDRGTEEQQHFKRKIRGYVEALRSGAFAEHYGTDRLTVAVTTFVGERRVRQMREWTEQVLDATKADWELGTTFLFADLPRDLTPARAWIEPCWQLAYAKHPQQYSLLVM